MLRFQNLIIVFLGVILSLFLFHQGEKYNSEKIFKGRIPRQCEEIKISEDCLRFDENYFKDKFSATFWDLQNQKLRQKINLVIPTILLITTLFVAFAVSRLETLFSGIAVFPLFLKLLGDYPYRMQFDTIFFYLLFVIGLAFLIGRFKRRFFG